MRNVPDCVVFRAIPDFVSLDMRSQTDFLDLDPPDVFSALVGEWNNVFIRQEGEDADSQAGDEDGRNDPVETQAASAHGENLVFSGEKNQRERARKQSGERYGEKNEMGYLVQKIQCRVGQGRVRFEKIINSLDKLRYQKEGDGSRLTKKHHS